MFSKVIVLLAVFHAQRVNSYVNSRLTVSLFTPAQTSNWERYEGDHGGHKERQRYHAPLFIPKVLHDRHNADTPEVSAAKAEHFAAVAKASGHSGRLADGHRGYSGHGDARYHGPTAIPHVLSDGHIADTLEVAAAKDEHLAAVAKARTAAGYNNRAHHGELSGTHHGNTPHASYHGPINKPYVHHTGYLADTHEVAAVKYQPLGAASHRKNYVYNH